MAAGGDRDSFEAEIILASANRFYRQKRFRDAYDAYVRAKHDDYKNRLAPLPQVGAILSLQKMGRHREVLSEFVVIEKVGLSVKTADAYLAAGTSAIALKKNTDAKRILSSLRQREAYRERADALLAQLE